LIKNVNLFFYTPISRQRLYTINDVHFKPLVDFYPNNVSIPDNELVMIDLTIE